MPGRHHCTRVRRRVLLLGLLLLVACGALCSSTTALPIVASLSLNVPVSLSGGVVGLSVWPGPGDLRWDTYNPPLLGLPYACGQRTSQGLQIRHPTAFGLVFWHCSF